MSFYATINNFIAENAIIFSVFIPIISGSIGAYVSYRITIKSEKRKEFNNAVEPLLDQVEFLIDSILDGMWRGKYFGDINLRDIYIRIKKQDKNKLKELLDIHNGLTEKINSIQNEQIDKIGVDRSFGYQLDTKTTPEIPIYLSNLYEILKIIKLK